MNLPYIFSIFTPSSTFLKEKRYKVLTVENQQNSDYQKSVSILSFRFGGLVSEFLNPKNRRK